jgi:hypothetical protein
VSVGTARRCFTLSFSKWLFVCATISAIADFIAILKASGLLGNTDDRPIGEIRAVSEAPKKVRKWGLAVVLFVITVACCGYGYYRIGELESQLEEVSPGGPNYLLEWGPGNAGALRALANGRGLASYKDDFKLAAIAFHNVGMIDEYDIETIQKSNLCTRPVDE